MQRREPTRCANRVIAHRGKAQLFDHVVGNSEQRRLQKAEGPNGLEVNNEPELVGCRVAI